MANCIAIVGRLDEGPCEHPFGGQFGDHGPCGKPKDDALHHMEWAGKCSGCGRSGYYYHVHHPHEPPPIRCGHPEGEHYSLRRRDDESKQAHCLGCCTDVEDDRCFHEPVQEATP